MKNGYSFPDHNTGDQIRVGPCTRPEFVQVDADNALLSATDAPLMARALLEHAEEGLPEEVRAEYASAVAALVVLERAVAFDTDLVEEAKRLRRTLHEDGKSGSWEVLTEKSRRNWIRVAREARTMHRDAEQ